MDFKIIMKDNVYDKLFCLMNNIKDINSGDEIGAWILGDWKTNRDNDTLTLLIDNFIIPKQKVSGAEVDISPESMSDTVREIGIKNANRIRGHWHIHPFGTGETNWSSIDETKINDFTSIEKERDLFVFLLSSLDTLKARVEFVGELKIPLIKETFKIKQSIDDLEVERESGYKKSPYLEELKQRIKDKVEKQTFNTGYNVFDKYNVGNLKDIVQAETTDIKQDNYIITKNGQFIRIKLANDFYKTILKYDEGFITSIPANAKIKTKATYIEYGCWFKTDVEAEEFKDKIEQILIDYDTISDLYSRKSHKRDYEYNFYDY